MLFELSDNVIHYGFWSVATMLGLADLVWIPPSLCDEILYVKNHCELLKNRSRRNIKNFETGFPYSDI